LKFKGRGKEWQEIRGEPRQVADVLLHLAEALDFALSLSRSLSFSLSLSPLSPLSLSLSLSLSSETDSHTCKPNPIPELSRLGGKERVEALIGAVEGKAEAEKGTTEWRSQAISLSLPL
jgi:hypothetical protein